MRKVPLWAQARRMPQPPMSERRWPNIAHMNNKPATPGSSKGRSPVGLCSPVGILGTRDILHQQAKQ
eukprot:12930850-Prorocentrum_lima.AAC.1